LSVLTYTYLYSSILFFSSQYSIPVSSFPPNIPSTRLIPNNSTPHKLSEGCLEWWMVIGIWFCFVLKCICSVF
jgi:hypothetical protein